MADSEIFARGIGPSARLRLAFASEAKSFTCAYAGPGAPSVPSRQNCTKEPPYTLQEIVEALQENLRSLDQRYNVEFVRYIPALVTLFAADFPGIIARPNYFGSDIHADLLLQMKRQRPNT